MRTTLDLPEKLLNEAMKITHTNNEGYCPCSKAIDKKI